MDGSNEPEILSTVEWSNGRTGASSPWQEESTSGSSVGMSAAWIFQWLREVPPMIVERSAEIAPLRQSHGTDLVALSLPCAAPATIDLAVRRLVSPIKIESTIHKDSDYHCLQLIKQKAENQKWKELSFSIVGRPSPLSQQQSDHG